LDELKPYVGGQAVIEGVMMRSPRSLAVAARRPDGTIVTRERGWVSLFEHLRFLRWPFVRGVIVLVESMMNGLSALQFAAQLQMPPGEREIGPGEVVRTGADMPIEPPTRSMGGTIFFAFILAMALFVGLPHLLAWGTGRALHVGVDQLGFHVLDGGFKLAIFVGYIWGIGRVPEIARVFQYHGAEHKAVNCYENGLPLTLEEARRQTTFHARCGTSFILFVLTLSIFVFAAVLPLFPLFDGPAWAQHLTLVAIKIPLMLPLAGIAYEINRYAARHPSQVWVQAIVAPGRMMQKLTTREPDDRQLEIALVALETALAAEARLAPLDVREALARPPAGVTVYKDYGDYRHVRDAAAC